MPAANAVLADRAIDHAHDLLRYSAGVVRRMIAVLNRTDASLVAQLSQALLQMERETFTVERLESLLGSVRRLNADAYAAVLQALEPDLRGLARVEAAAEVASYKAAVPSVAQIRFPIAGVSAEQVYAAAMARPFQGRLLKDWASNLEAGRLTAIRNTVRSGFVEGRTTSEIIRTIRGTKALSYADGVLARPRRELAAVVQTALSHTAQTARQQMVDANADLVKAVQWVSTLDTKTSPMCRVRDGLKYTADTHKPIGHSVPWGEGPGRLHFNCRSVSVPVLKSWRELGVDMDDMTPATRASMDGQVPAETTYAEWFARQSPARQEDILGPERYQLMKTGKVSYDQFYDSKGRWLSLEQLEASAAR
ncbi:phage minor head protein [Luteibacter sp. E-22]|uniref:phage minor head protein n=1 Tax=Luteibacter sp. E-22 TaxID=3404050 RepID=UPI003CF07300